MPRVGILSLQGDFARHRAALEALGAEVSRVTLPADLEGADALVLPGGESTTMLRLLDDTGLRAPLEAFVAEKPVLGTCAGLVLLGRGAGRLPAPTLGLLDVDVERNAYGRQVDSFQAQIETAWAPRFEGVFIRAPRVRRVGDDIEVVARLAARHPAPAGPPAGEPVGVRRGRVVGLCFHPELTPDLGLHRWFLGEVAGLDLPAAAAAPVAAGEAR